MYRNAWPLLALATYKQLLERTAGRFASVNGQPREVAELPQVRVLPISES
jgi:hypothetical protein